MAKNISSKNLIMEELLASSTKVINLRRGQEVEGGIVAINNSELILDLGAKSEGVIPKKEFPSSGIENLKIGDKVKAFVIFSENENGQIVLSLHQVQPKTGRRGREINWARFKNAQRGGTKLSGTITEINKGGLMVEVDGVRGFLPNSLSGFEILGKNISSQQELVGQTVHFLISEIDENTNKLIFTQKSLTDNSVKVSLRNFKKGDKFKGKVSAILPFGFVLAIPALPDRQAGGSQENQLVRGLVLISEVAWERTEDLSAFSNGQEVEALVLGADEDLGRLNLSIKQLSDDPFAKLAEKFPADEAVRGEVVSQTEAGVIFKFKDGVEGLLPSSRMNPGQTYEAGASMQMLVDSIDVKKRRINLAPFITSTEGLIYK